MPSLHTPNAALRARFGSAAVALRSALALLVIALLGAGCDYSTRSDIGPPGSDGQDADVRAFTFAFDGGDLFVSEDGLSAYAQVEVDDLTLDIVDYGVVLAYADGGLLRAEDAGVTWTALPVTFGVALPDDDDPDVDYTLTYSFSYEIGFLYVDLFASEALTWEDQPILDVKAVLIPGTEPFDAATVNTSDYAAVALSLDLDVAPSVRATVRSAQGRPATR